MHVLMVAAENDALPGAKVGGIADVVRDLPRAIAAHKHSQDESQDHTVSVVVPSYGVLHELAGASSLAELDVAFLGDKLRVSLWQITVPDADAGVRQFVLHSAAFALGKRGQVYCDDPPQRPFASDANKFALFSAAVCKAVAAGLFGALDVIHLHDWHAALVLLLRACDPAYAALQRIRCVYTIHNLALQGVRPLRGDPSSLTCWFPQLVYARAQVEDPRWKDCINLMAVGIRLSDAVNTVSPSYAQDILKPDAIEDAGFHGGEGLQDDLNAAQREGRLIGVLNGCYYPPQRGAPTRQRSWPELLKLLRAEVLVLAGQDAVLASAHYIALRRLQDLGRKRPRLLVTSVGRAVEQKLGLLRLSCDDRRCALDALLCELGEHGLLIMLGDGDPQIETMLRMVAARHENFLFICGYSPKLADALYHNGDLFLMPSSYEPCGISQMLAMRAGQPCLVHHVGGLRDTVRHGVDGFGFSGESRAAQVTQMLRAFSDVRKLRDSEPARYKQIAKAAAAVRFSWAASAAVYLHNIYRAS
ncbi:MAG: starch synthase [Gammaproteobacteria bacterium]|jgi:starch synthase